MHQDLRKTDTSSPSASARPVPGLREAAADLAFIVARQGLKLAALPTLALPPALRRTVVASARLPAKASSILPRRVASTLKGFADDLQDMEAVMSRREDLGSRLRREDRRRKDKRRKSQRPSRDKTAR